MTVDFLVGLTLGGLLGVGGYWLTARIRGWLGRSELSLLRSENRQLSRRLAEKDRHVKRMLSETERLAERLGRQKIVLSPETDPAQTEELLGVKLPLNP